MKSLRLAFNTYILKSLFRPLNSFVKIKSKTMNANKTMIDLGYAFNSEGQLRKIGNDGSITEEPFQFNISNDHQHCQSHYEKLGDAITDHIYGLLESQEKLIRLPVPKDSTPDCGTFIFASKDYNKKNILMVLIHGSGAVRAGQWARSLIINENLDMGTQIPYIKEAATRDYGIIVLNPNDNIRENKNISQSGSAEEHSKYVWENYVKPTNAKTVVVVAHSYGGYLTLMLSDLYRQDFEKRVKAVALTDSVHRYSRVKMNDLLKVISKNWISSSSPLDTPINTPEYDIMRVSAGNPKHEMTSYSCMSSVFKFIDEKLKTKK